MFPMDINEQYSLTDWLFAYRKAKVDMFYSSYCDKISLAKYEENLIPNLEKLKKQFDDCCADNTFSSFCSENFLGDYYFTGKKYDIDVEKNSKPETTFRLMANPSINFQVLSALWMQKAGVIFEKHFEKEFNVLYANRLRTTQTGESNIHSLGSFLPYTVQYGQWKQQAIDTITDLNKKGQPCTIVCLDVSNYFYSINPSFLSQQNYCDLFQSPLVGNLHNCFCSMLDTWNRGPFSEQLGKPLGLPVGLTASGFVANLAFMKFDKGIIKSCSPLYYGRYVDDILVVIAGKDNINTFDDFFCTLQKQDLQSIKVVSNEQKNIWGCYINESKYTFNPAKGQIIHIYDEKTTAQFEVFVQQLQKRTSEWRALPHVPPPQQIYTYFVRLVNEYHENSQNFCDLKNLVVQPSSFVFLLRDCESITRVLKPQEWEQIRQSFINAYTDFIIEEKTFFQFEKYLFRVIELGILCDDYECIKSLLGKVTKTVEDLFSNSNLKIAGDFTCTSIKDRYKEFLYNSIYQAIVLTSPTQHYQHLCDDMPDLTKLLNISPANILKDEDAYEKCFLSDLTYFPTKSIMISHEQTPLALYSFGEKLLNKFFINQNIVEYWKQLTCSIGEPDYHHNLDCMLVPFTEALSHYLQFPTRPLNEYDMYFMLSDTSSQNISFEFSELESILQQFRGYGKTNIPENNFGIQDGIFKVPLTNSPSKTVNIAVASISMKEEKLDLLIRELPEQNILNRYRRFTLLINDILKYPEKIDYVVFPELALPPRWFIQAAHKLFRAKINIISGIEYLTYKQSNESKITNQVWASLRHSMFDYDSFVFLRQRKQFPSYHEIIDIETKSTFKWQPSHEEGKDNEQLTTCNWPIIIQHGDFFFAILICAELMNIEYRNNLRGKIDCLIIPEWNPDITTFEALINSAAIDLHAYIVQCNNNLYGDCRIRAPYKKDYQRDIIKSKGGLNDYFLVGKIDVEALRNFQCTNRPNLNQEVNLNPFRSAIKCPKSVSIHSRKNIRKYTNQKLAIISL